VLGIGAGGGDDGFQAGLLGGQRVEIGIGLAVGRVHGFELGLGGKHRAHAGFDAFAHGVGRVQLGLLRQVADVQAGHGGGFTLDLLVQSGHDLEQGGLAGAVGAQHADLGAGEKAERHLLEDVALGRHDLADLVHGKYVLSHQDLVW
jgi:hypothetical protein